MEQGGGEGGGGNRQRERVSERERGAEVNTEVNYMDIHVHSWKI